MKIKHILLLIFLTLIIYIDTFAIIHIGDINPPPDIVFSWFFLILTSITLIILLSFYILDHKYEILKILNKRIL